MATGTGAFPGAIVISERAPAALAADATVDVVLGVVPALPAGAVYTVTGVTYTPDTVLTGADTNSATLDVINKGAAGAGTASVASKAFTNGVNAPAFDETAITNSGTAANLDCNAGDVLAYRRTKVGTGLATPAGVVTVRLTRA